MYRLISVLNSMIAVLVVAQLPTNTLSAESQLLYDPLNRLTKVSHPSGSKTDYTYDAVGNRFTYEGSVNNIGDTIIPVISVTSPTGGSFFNSTSPSFSLSGIASDNVGIAKVSWQNDAGQFGLAAGGTTWTIPNLPLRQGANIFTVTAHDQAGNTSDATLTVNFTPGSGSAVLTINSSANGRVERSPNQQSYDTGSQVTLTAIPNEGYRFTGWSGDASGLANPLSVTMTGNKTIAASFSALQEPSIFWEKATGESYVDSTAGIASNGNIYFVAPNGILHAFNQNREALWDFNFNKSAGGATAIGTDGTLYFSAGGARGGGSDGTLYAVNPNGTLKWSFVAGNRITASPAIAEDGTVYVGSYDRKLRAFTPGGQLKWEFTAGDRIERPASIGSDGTVYFGSIDSKVYAINPGGSKKWEFATGSQISSGVAIGTDGTIYIGSHDHHLYALTTSGSLKWKYNMGSLKGDGSPVLDNAGNLYFGDRAGKLHSLTVNGAKRWEFDTGGEVANAPSITADGSIYVASISGKLFALNTSGAKQWELPLGAPVGYSSPTIAPDGTIYLGLRNSKFVAIRGNSPLAETPWPSERQGLQNTGRVPPPQLGSLQVTIIPAGAIVAGAQWQVDGGGFQNAGAAISGLPIGTHTVSFKAINGWTTPANQTVAIAANQTTTVTGTYVKLFGLTVSPTIHGSVSRVPELDFYPSGVLITVTAIPDEGYEFGGWTDDPSIRAAQRTITMDTDRTISATFVRKAGLLAHYPFDGRLNDSSGNGFDGIDFGAVSDADRFGNPNSAIRFTGTANWAKLPIGSSHFSDNFTIALWLKLDDFAAQYPAIINGDTGFIRLEAAGPLYTGEGNYRKIKFYQLGQSQVWSGTTFDTGRWYHLAVVRSGANYRIYVNGALSGENDMPPVNVSGNYLQVGNDALNTFGGAYFHGSLDDLKIYTQALSPSAVQELFAGQPPIPHLNSVVVGNGGLRCVLRGPSRAQVLIEASVNLVDWTLAGTHTLPASGSMEITLVEQITTQAGGRFYRARLVESPVPFSDNFNRSDSATVGNGWINAPSNGAFNLIIKDGRLTVDSNDPTETGAIVYHPMPPLPVTVSLKFTDKNGFGSLRNRYQSSVAVLYDPTTGKGYGLQFTRADQTFNDSKVTIWDGDTTVATIPCSFQFGTEISVNASFRSDGSIQGTISDSQNNFPFSVAARAIESTGGNVMIGLNRSGSGTILPTADDFSLTSP